MNFRLILKTNLIKGVREKGASPKQIDKPIGKLNKDRGNVNVY